MQISEHVPKEAGQPWKYECEDLFGFITFTCSKQLPHDILDAVISAVTNVKAKAETIKGSMPYEDTEIFYTLKKASQWGLNPGEEEELCKKETTTSEKRTGLGYLVQTTRTKITQTINRLQRYVEALRSAWRNSQ